MESAGLNVTTSEMTGLEIQSPLAEAGSKMPIIFMSANENIATRQQAWTDFKKKTKKILKQYIPASK